MILWVSDLGWVQRPGLGSAQQFFCWSGMASLCCWAADGSWRDLRDVKPSVCRKPTVNIFPKLCCIMLSTVPLAKARMSSDKGFRDRACLFPGRTDKVTCPEASERMSGRAWWPFLEASMPGLSGSGFQMLQKPCTTRDALQGDSCSCL